jgi:diaminopimelate decarboxylase
MWYLENDNREKIINLARKNKTPFYLYHIPTLQKEIDKYKNVFGSYNVDLLYAVKANFNKAILKIIRNNGFGADVVSGWELKRVIDCGFKKISFSGVGKTDDEIILAIKNKIYFINIESFEEFERIKYFSEKLKIKTSISVRINPDVDINSHNYITTAKKYSKFGVDFKTAFEIYTTTQKSPYLDIKAIHFHLGSQIFSSKPYEIALKKIITFLDDLKKKGIHINIIDIGGGWGVKEGNQSKGHKKLFNVLKPYLKNYKFILEPGRSIVASSGVLVTKVLYRKKVYDKYIVIVDAGMNNLIRPSLYGVYHPIINLSSKSNKSVLLDIAGPVCESSDFFARNIRFPLPERDDILIIASCGAYGYSMSSNYNLRPFTAEYLIY